jgi:hypothetical protein
MHRMHRRLAWLLPVFATLALCSSANAAGWMWSFTPYAWLVGGNTDFTVNDRDLASRDVTFHEMTLKVDMAAQGHFEGQNGPHGFFVDGTYVNLSTENDHFVINGSHGLEARTDVKLTMIDFAGIYNPREDGLGLSVIYGARTIYAATIAELDFDASTDHDLRFDTNKTLWDGLLGIRYVAPLGEHLVGHFRGDVSKGSTEFTWNGMLGLGWAFGDSNRYTALVGYRYMEINFKDRAGDAKFETKTALQGAIVGFTFRW